MIALWAVLASLVLPLARADEISVRDAHLRSVEDGLVLDADFDFDLTPRLIDTSRLPHGRGRSDLFPARIRGVSTRRAGDRCARNRSART